MNCIQGSASNRETSLCKTGTGCNAAVQIVQMVMVALLNEKLRRGTASSPKMMRLPCPSSQTQCPVGIKGVAMLHRFEVGGFHQGVHCLMGV